MKSEGVYKQQFLIGDEWTDQLVYSISATGTPGRSHYLFNFFKEVAIAPLIYGNQRIYIV